MKAWLFILALLSVAMQASAGPAKPNVVYIMSDDVGWGDLSVHGGGVPTPNIDRLFSQGVELTQFMGYVPFHIAHAPLQAKEVDLAAIDPKKAANLPTASGKTTDEDKHIHAAMLHSMDRNVAAIRAEIEKLGLSENTIFVFTSDNGAMEAGISLPLRGHKHMSVWEHRVIGLASTAPGPLGKHGVVFNGGKPGTHTIYLDNLRIRHANGSTTPLWTNGKDTRVGNFKANELFKDLKIRAVSVAEAGE